MRVPLPWLREYCDPALDTAAVEERLTMTGTKVEAVLHHGVDSTEGFVVGRVASAEAHPDADRLRVCAVDVGDGAPATIVCGAPNVAAGQTVAVARPGAVLPGGVKLERRKLRGIESEGMILAESELAIPADDGAGILVLDGMLVDAELAPGTPLADVLAIAMDVLELEITPNRPDCLGVYGVARELHAATGAALAPEPWLQDGGSAGTVEAVTVAVECPDLCLRFTARVFEDVTVASSPPWLKARLAAAGQRPINNVVDITNYAMLLTGQPLHAFDLDRVAGARLTVRRAHEREQVDTLDGQTRTLGPDMVVIEDGDGPTSIAGVMGGARSEVEPDTTRVLMEVATWNGPNIHRTSWALGLRSEASSRFEKGLQPEQTMHAQAVAARLMVELCGARLLPGTIDVGDRSWESDRPVIALRERRVEAILGVHVERARQREILQALDFGVADRDDCLDVTVPAVRRDDVSREIDLIEEVARVDGLERLPATLPARRKSAGRLSHRQRIQRAAEDALVGRGLHEIVGWSFAEPSLLDRLLLPAGDPLRNVITLENPLSDGQSIMRPTILGSLLEAARHNVARNGPDVAIFESGTVYRSAPANGAAPAGPVAGIDEHHGLGVLLSGRLQPRAWRGSAAEADFFAAKALLEALLARLGVPFAAVAHAFPYLHPGRSAMILAGGAGEDAGAGGGAGAGAGAADRDAEDEGADAAADRDRMLGWLGELHPTVAAAWDLPHPGTGGRTAAFAIDLGKVAALAPAVRAFQAFGPFPPLRQDIAVTLPVEVPAAQLLALVREAAGVELEDVRVFDVYTGEQVGAGRRSLALALSFRALDRTLTDEDVAPRRERIVAAVKAIGGELRG